MLLGSTIMEERREKSKTEQKLSRDPIPRRAQPIQLFSWIGEKELDFYIPLHTGIDHSWEFGYPSEEACTWSNLKKDAKNTNRNCFEELRDDNKRSKIYVIRYPNEVKRKRAWKSTHRNNGRKFPKFGKWHKPETEWS